MPSPLNPNDLVTLEELTISNMWEVAGVIEVLEGKGVMTKQDILTEIRELRKMNPTARTPREFDEATAQPEAGGQFPTVADLGVLSLEGSGMRIRHVPMWFNLNFCR